MIRSFARCALSVAVALQPMQARAVDSAARSLAANCTGCHGPNGASTGTIPSIAGMAKERMVSAMNAFREGKREATVMHQHAKGYTDDQVEAMASWFAAQK